MNEKLIEQIASNVRRRLNTAIVESDAASSTTSSSAPGQYFAPWTSAVYESEVHPSQQLFNVGEATEAQSAVRELVEFLETKECSIEKGKLCDHCGTCRSLGF